MATRIAIGWQKVHTTDELCIPAIHMHASGQTDTDLSCFEVGVPVRPYILVLAPQLAKGSLKSAMHLYS